MLKKVRLFPLFLLFFASIAPSTQAHAFDYHCFVATLKGLTAQRPIIARYETYPMGDVFKGEEIDPGIHFKNNHYFTTYLSPLQRARYQVTIARGVMKNAEGQPIKSGHFIYVMDENGRFYLGNSERGKFHHSSFLAGQPVAAAGEIRFSKTGRMQINNISGHYLPDVDCLRQVLTEFKKNGVDLSKIDVEIWDQVFNGRFALKALMNRRTRDGKPTEAMAPLTPLTR